MKTPTEMNQLANAIGKHPSAFTKMDLMAFIQQEQIRHVNFMYPASDGRLKSLNFVLHDNVDYLNEILTCGERVDGSSLFGNMVDASSSDLYVIPRYATAFLDPFAPYPTVTMLCDFFDKDGNPLEACPSHTLRKACEVLRSTTGGLELQAMGELEYYVIGKSHNGDGNLFPANDQRGYHESAPFAKFSNFRQECLHKIAQVGGRIKYGHCEVGNFQLEGNLYEQHEIEFLPVPATESADQLMLAKWIIRNVAHEKGLDVTFAPKVTTGKYVQHFCHYDAAL
jgi:glutamine synthetase